MNAIVTIPREEYHRLRAAAEDLADLQCHDRARAALVAGGDELIPSGCANRLLDGQDPLRVYRDLRGLTQTALTRRAGANRVTVAEIETGRKQGSIAALRALAGCPGCRAGRSGGAIVIGPWQTLARLRRISRAATEAASRAACSEVPREKAKECSPFGNAGNGSHPQPHGLATAANPANRASANMDPGAIPGWLFRPPIRRTTRTDTRIELRHAALMDPRRSGRPLHDIP